MVALREAAALGAAVLVTVAAEVTALEMAAEMEVDATAVVGAAMGVAAMGAVVKVEAVRVAEAGMEAVVARAQVAAGSAAVGLRAEVELKEAAVPVVAATADGLMLPSCSNGFGRSLINRSCKRCHSRQSPADNTHRRYRNSRGTLLILRTHRLQRTPLPACCTPTSTRRLRSQVTMTRALGTVAPTRLAASS